MTRGQRVEVTQAFDGKAFMRIVEWTDKLVFVCRETEYVAAEAVNRAPNSTGFPREFVRELEASRKLRNG